AACAARPAVVRVPLEIGARIGGSAHSLADRVAVGAARTTGTVDAGFSGSTGFAAGAAVACVRLQIHAGVSADRAFAGRTRSAVAGFTLRAGLAARAAVGRVGGRVGAGRSTHRAFAARGGAGVGLRAGVVATAGGDPDAVQGHRPVSGQGPASQADSGIQGDAGEREDVSD